jgi:hypothetical protein
MIIRKKPLQHYAHEAAKKILAELPAEKVKALCSDLTFTIPFFKPRVYRNDHAGISSQTLTQIEAVSVKSLNDFYTDIVISEIKKIKKASARP